jgi:hypothetical protein
MGAVKSSCSYKSRETETRKTSRKSIAERLTRKHLVNCLTVADPVPAAAS